MRRCKCCLAPVYSPGQTWSWYHAEILVLDSLYRASEYNMAVTLAPEVFQETCAGPLEPIVEHNSYSSRS